MTDPFRTRDHVPDFDRHVAAYAARSRAARARLPLHANLSYGPGAAERLDLFVPPAPNGRVHMFIHGGYWRMFGKDDFSFVAETIIAAGAIAVIVDYALMPAVRMHIVVEQLRRARDWVLGHIGAYGGDPARFSVSGHSAGAHLAALLLTAEQPAGRIGGALLLSGIYDLAPLRTSFLEELIALTDEEVARFSPLRLPYLSGPRVELLVGARETAPFHSQADAFAAHLGAAGTPARLTRIADADHMSLVGDLGTPGTATARHLAALLE